LSLFNNYFDNIFETSDKNLTKLFSNSELNLFKNNKDYIDFFINEYCKIIKKKHQLEYKKSDKKLNNFINEESSNIKIIWGDCLKTLQMMDSESIHLMVTSPPYYNEQNLH